MAVSLGQTIGGVAVDGDDVYWTLLNGGPVQHCTVSGTCNGGSGDGFANVASPVGPIAVDANNVYWATIDGVQACARANCVPWTMSSGGSEPRRFAVDGVNVYWTEYVMGSPGRVMKAAADADAAVQLAMGQGLPYGIATDGNNVYWADDGAGVGAGAMECSVGGCPGTGPIPIWSGQTNGAVDIAISGGTVYWSLPDDSIVSCPIAGCTGSPPTYWDAAAPAFSVRTDGVRVFWSGSGAPITECTLPACTAPKKLVNAATEYITLAAAAVYWTDGQTIYRVAK